MAYAVNGLAGVDLTETVAGTGTSNDEGNEWPLGHCVQTNEGQTYMYVHASGAIDQYDFVGIDEEGEAVALVDAQGAAGHTLGVAQVAFADNAFGWVCVDAPRGNVNANVLASCAADTESLWTTATAGHVDDATSGGAVRLEGVRLVAAAAGAATNREVSMSNAKFTGF